MNNAQIIVESPLNNIVHKNIELNKFIIERIKMQEVHCSDSEENQCENSEEEEEEEEELSMFSDGNGLYLIQSCMNHSCSPNAELLKESEDKDGQVVVKAKKDICSGEQITISYIDEKNSLQERREALLDYGFICNCEKCKDEEAEIK